jgi:UDP-glucose 4-epimerase
MAKRILVTGGAGFIGSHLVDKLIEQGNEVTVIDNLSTGLEENIKNGELTPRGLPNAKNLSFYDFDQVYHLGAIVGYKRVLDSPIGCLLDNIKFTEDVFTYARITRAKVLFTSSSEVYGLGANYLDSIYGIKETSRHTIFGMPQNGKDCYAISKWAGELLFSQNKYIDSVIVRLFNTSGPRQRPEFGMVIPSFINAALNNKPIIITGDGKQRRCFCHVSDTVDALIGLMNSNTKSGEVFNIGNPDNDYSINELAEVVKSIVGKGQETKYVPHDSLYKHNSFSDVSNRKPDISKIQKHIGWKPKVRLPQIVEDNMEWQVQHYGIS